MDYLEHAENRYREVMPRDYRQQDPVERAVKPAFNRRQVNHWLNEDVTRAVASLWDRPSFRELATWPQLRIAPGAQTPERQQVEGLARQIADSAAALLKVVGVPRVAKQLPAACPPTQVVVAQTVRISSEEPEQVISRQRGMHSELPVLQALVQKLATRQWELVCVHDYYRPRSDWYGAVYPPPRSAGQPIAPALGDLHPYFNPELLPVGDLITRMMRARIGIHMRSLRDFRVCVLKALHAAGGFSLKAAVTEQDVWTHLRRGLDALAPEFDSPQARAREAAITLTQVHLALRPQADALWLGLPANASASPTSLRSSLCDRVDLNALDRIALALYEMRLLHHTEPAPSSESAIAVAKFDLVLSENPQALYWRGNKLRIDWGRNRMTWQFWLQLAKKCRFHGYVTMDDVYGTDQVMTSSAFYSVKARADTCVRTHAPELVGLIEDAHGERRYRLNLQHDKVHVIPARP